METVFWKKKKTSGQGVGWLLKCKAICCYRTNLKCFFWYIYGLIILNLWLHDPAYMWTLSAVTFTRCVVNVNSTYNVAELILRSIIKYSTFKSWDEKVNLVLGNQKISFKKNGLTTTSDVKLLSIVTVTFTVKLGWIIFKVRTRES